MLNAQDDPNQPRSADACADALPLSAETCRTLAALLPRSFSGFGVTATRQVLSSIMFEPAAPPDPSRLSWLPLLRWDRRANGFATSLPQGTCWVEGNSGTVMRCAFDMAGNDARAAERYDEVRAVLHEVVPRAWRAAISPRSVLFSDGQVVRAALHRVNFGAADWVADSPQARWIVLLSLGPIGKHADVPAELWTGP